MDFLMLVIRPKNITSGGVLVWILPKSDLIQHFGCKSFTGRSPRKQALWKSVSTANAGCVIEWVAEVSLLWSLWSNMWKTLQNCPNERWLRVKTYLPHCVKAILRHNFLVCLTVSMAEMLLNLENERLWR